MKKTIYMSVLTCALAFCAGAATEITSDAAASGLLGGALYTDATGKAGTSTVDWSEATSNSFTLTMTLNASELAHYIGTNADSWSSTNETRVFFNVVGDKQLGMKLFVYQEWNGLTGYHSGNKVMDMADSTSSTALHRLQDVDMSNISEAAITFSHEDGVDTWAYLTLVSNEGTSTTYWAQEDGLRWREESPANSGNYVGIFGELTSITYDSSLVTSTYLMNAAVSAGGDKLNTAALSAAVPEPTTATLSLLALAGLAARRRRK